MIRRRKKSAVPYKQTPHQKRPPVPVAYAKTPRNDSVALTGVTKIDSTATATLNLSNVHTYLLFF